MDESKVREIVRTLRRSVIERLLEGASIQCYDHETTGELEEALVVNVLDGTIPAESLEDH